MAQTETKPTSLSAWKKGATHFVTLPSGAQVKIKVPNLPALIKGGQLPNELVEIAIRSQQLYGNLDEVKLDDIKAQAEFYDYLVLQTVVEPKLAAEDLNTIPFPDIEMIVELATRARDVDAVGHHIGGLEATAAWRKFRGLTSGDEGLLDE